MYYLASLSEYEVATIKDTNSDFVGIYDKPTDAKSELGDIMGITTAFSHVCDSSELALLKHIDFTKFEWCHKQINGKCNKKLLEIDSALNYTDRLDLNTIPDYILKFWGQIGLDDYMFFKNDKLYILADYAEEESSNYTVRAGVYKVYNTTSEKKIEAIVTKHRLKCLS